MADFPKLAATAQRLIEKNGRSVVLYRTSRAPANTGQPWRGTAQLAADGAGVSVIGCFVPAAGSGFGRQRVIDGTLQDSFEQVCLVAANSMPAGVELEGFSSLVDGGKAWKIDAVDKLQPADVALVYVLGLSS